jgi:type II secretory pathway pseudopilin PulG
MELMIVISLIGILVMIVIGSLWEGRVKGQIAATKQQLHEINQAMAMYYFDHGVYPPEVGEPDPLANPGHDGDHCSMCEFAKDSTPYWFGAKWSAIANILAVERYLGKGVNTDPWGNDYLYDKNEGVSCFLRSPICSKGPDGILQTPNCESTTLVYGDDICVFLEDNPNDRP